MYTRLTNITVESGNRPESKIVVKIYGGTDKYYSSPYLRGSAITSYLQSDLKFSPEKRRNSEAEAGLFSEEIKVIHNQL